jgi:Peptidase family M48
MSTRRSTRPALALHHGALAFWLPVFLMAATSARANERPSTSAMAVRLQALVDALRSELHIPQDVALQVVKENPLMASVEPTKAGDGFVLSIEEGFASRLTDDELKGVLAHELGHVWIFTHHPYLQTEQLANRIAMRLVSRENLEQVYQKVWKNGAKGDLGHFLGIAAAPAPAKTADAAPAPAPAAAAPTAPAAGPSGHSGDAKESTSTATTDSKDLRH